MSIEEVIFTSRGLSSTHEILLGSIEVQEKLTEIINNYNLCIARHQKTIKELEKDLISTKRERLAGQAMQGILANSQYEAPRSGKLEGMAIDAVYAADVLILELDKGGDV